MSTSEGYNIDQKVFDKLDEIDRKKIQKNIPHYHSKMIYKELPDDVITSEDALDRIKQRTNLNDDQINSGLKILVDNENVVKTTGYHTNKTFYRKNVYKPL